MPEQATFKGTKLKNENVDILFYSNTIKRIIDDVIQFEKFPAERSVLDWELNSEYLALIAIALLIELPETTTSLNN